MKHLFSVLLLAIFPTAALASLTPGQQDLIVSEVVFGSGDALLSLSPRLNPQEAESLKAAIKDGRLEILNDPSLSVQAGPRIQVAGNCKSEGSGDDSAEECARRRAWWARCQANAKCRNEWETKGPAYDHLAPKNSQRYKTYIREEREDNRRRAYCGKKSVVRHEDGSFGCEGVG